MDRLQNLDYILRHLLGERGEQVAQLPAQLQEKQRLMRALMNVRPPRPAPPDFLRAQDAELRLQAEEKGIVEMDEIAADSDSQGHPFTLWQGDITRLRVDAIVNAANAQMLGCWSPLHNCIDNCIHSAAGIQLRQECHELMQAQGHDEPTGEAKITRGYNLPARHVIHTVGPICTPMRSLHAGSSSHIVPTPEQTAQLASCYRSCLSVANRHGLRSIAFCCISTGVFSFPNDRAAAVAVATVKEWLASHPDASIRHVVFNVFLDKDRELYQQLL